MHETFLPAHGPPPWDGACAGLAECHMKAVEFAQGKQFSPPCCEIFR
jgi:hypothetical protein